MAPVGEPNSAGGEKYPYIPARPLRAFFHQHVTAALGRLSRAVGDRLAEAGRSGGMIPAVGDPPEHERRHSDGRKLVGSFGPEVLDDLKGSLAVPVAQQEGMVAVDCLGRHLLGVAVR